MFPGNPRFMRISNHGILAVADPIERPVFFHSEAFLFAKPGNLPLCLSNARINPLKSNHTCMEACMCFVNILVSPYRKLLGSLLQGNSQKRVFQKTWTRK